MVRRMNTWSVVAVAVVAAVLAGCGEDEPEFDLDQGPDYPSIAELAEVPFTTLTEDCELDGSSPYSVEDVGVIDLVCNGGDLIVTIAEYPSELDSRLDQSAALGGQSPSDAEGAPDGTQCVETEEGDTIETLCAIQTGRYRVQGVEPSDVAAGYEWLQSSLD